MPLPVTACHGDSPYQASREFRQKRTGCCPLHVRVSSGVVNMLSNMNIFVTDKTALSFWDALGRPPRRKRNSRRLERLEVDGPTAELRARFQKVCGNWFDEETVQMLTHPLHCTVGNPQERKRGFKSKTAVSMPLIWLLQAPPRQKEHEAFCFWHLRITPKNT